MHFIFVKLFFLQILILNKNKISAALERPCDPEDAVILTEKHKLTNGSYAYDNIIIPNHLIYLNNSILYGCICSIKECVPWCCSHKYQSLKNDICENEIINENILEDVVLLYSKNDNKTVNLFEHFHIQMDKRLICNKILVPLNPFEYEEEVWHIFSNGTVYQPYYDKIKEFDSLAPKNTYCFALEQYAEDAKNFIVSPYFCPFDNSNEEVRVDMYGIALLVSQPFMIITIIIYLAIPKLRNLHGKSLVCYLISLSVTYFCLAYILLYRNHINHLTLCIFVGYVGYLNIMSAYFWLSAICFDLWYNFSNYDKARKLQNQRFYKYCGICYGMASIYVIVALLVDKFGTLDSVKPGIGIHHCYINVMDGYSALIWLHGPLIFVIGFNITMFTLTWKRIKSVELELKHFTDNDNGERNLKQKRNMFHIFLRLFVIMGISWISEIISYFAGPNFEHFFYITDLFNAMQGLLIFLLFVFKKETKILLLQKYDKIRGREQYSKQYSNQYSRTMSTNISSSNQL